MPREGMEQLKIGIMGGTFDPIHIGHMLAAETVCEEAELDEVWFMPAYLPPHKVDKPAAAMDARWEMVCLATDTNPRFRPLDIELRRGGTSYTIDTIRQLRTVYPAHRFSFIIGGDMVASLPQWHKIEELVEHVSFIGLERPGTRIDWDRIHPSIRKCVQMVPMPAIDISSTYIRNRRQAGKSVRYMVDERVNDYMEEHQLYEA